MFSGTWDLVVDVADAVTVLLVNDFVSVVVAENVHQAASVPIVRHTTAIVDMAGCVLQHLFGIKAI